MGESPYYMGRQVLKASNMSALHLLARCLLSTALWGGYHYHPPFKCRQREGKVPSPLVVTLELQAQQPDSGI